MASRRFRIPTNLIHERTLADHDEARIILEGNRLDAVIAARGSTGAFGEPTQPRASCAGCEGSGAGGTPSAPSAAYTSSLPAATGGANYASFTGHGQTYQTGYGDGGHGYPANVSPLARYHA